MQLLAFICIIALYIAAALAAGLILAVIGKIMDK